MNLLIGEDFKNDGFEVHILLVKFTQENEMTEEKMQGHADQHNESLDYITLHNHFEVVSVLDIYITWDQQVLKNIFYMR